MERNTTTGKEDTMADFTRKPAAQIPHTEAVQGHQGTARYDDGSVGLVYWAPNGYAYRTTGSYWAVLVTAAWVSHDDGQGYLDAVRAL